MNRSPQNQVWPKRSALSRAVAALCAAAVLLMGTNQAFSGQQPPTDRGANHYEEKPAPIAGLDINEKLGEKIPLDLTFVDSDGEKVSIGKWFNQGRPVLVMFVYYRCPLACPQLMERYVNTFRAVDTLTIGKDYNVLVVSIDPTDTPQTAAAAKSVRMASYDRQPAKDVAAGWAFLTTPDSATSRRLADSLGFPYRYSAASNDYSHPSATFVLSPNGTVCRYLYKLEVPVQTLKLSLLEAGEGKIGTSLDRFTQWCYHFDPRTGSYTFAAWRFMQVGGFLSAVVVAGLLVRMLMHEWRRKFAERAAAAASAEVKKLSPGTGTAELAR